MSRVIKSAIMHGKPKIVENPVLALSEQTVLEDGVAAPENRLAVIATCSVLLEEGKAKAGAILKEAEAQHWKIINEADQQAKELLAKTAQETEQIKAAAYEEHREKGYQQGLDDGCAAAQEKMAAAVQAAAEKAERIIRLAEEDVKNAVADAETQIVKIAMAIADRVIPEHFIDAPQLIFPLVKAALDKVRDQNSIVVRVSPDNYEFVLMAKQELQMMLDGEDTLTITADPLQGNNGCVIESANGNVDARLETQLEIVKKAVWEVIA